MTFWFQNALVGRGTRRYAPSMGFSNEDRPWFVVMTRPRMEAEAESNLLNQRFEVYLPQWVENKRRAGGMQRVVSAMFPRYLFVRPTREQQDISVIRSTRGVVQMVRFGLTAARMSDGLLNQIRSIEQRRFNPEANLKRFKAGDSVVVDEGPFAGVQAKVFSSADSRVVLLMDLLGRQQKVAVDEAQVKAL